MLFTFMVELVVEKAQPLIISGGFLSKKLLIRLEIVSFKLIKNM